MPLDASIFASGLPQPNAALPIVPAAAPAGVAPVAPAQSPTPASAIPVTPSLVPIYGRESAFNPQAQNPTSTASGLGQDVNATWREAMHALGYGDAYPTAKSAPPAIQNAANIWLQGRYGNKPWAASEPGGGDNFAKLAQETQSIYGPIAEKYRAASEQSLAMLSKIDPNDPDLDKRIGEALDKTNALTDEVLQKMQKPPTPPTAEDAMKKLGSPAAILGILAGFMGRRHAIDSFSAAAAAISAGNQGDWQRYQVAQNVWKDQMQTLIHVSELQQQSLRNILEDRNVAMNEKLAVAGAKMRAMGLSLQGDVLEAKGADAALQMSARISEQNARMQEMLDMAVFRQQLKNAPGGQQKLEASKTLEVLDKDGNVVRTVLARESSGQAGWVDSQSGQPIKLDPGQTLREITPTTAGGGRAGAQVLRQEIAGREILSDLQNVSRMPVGSTTGFFGQRESGTSIMDAGANMLVRKLTPQDAQLMQASLASMTRELSILMSPVYGGNYAARQIEPLIPVAGDTVETTIFKLARLAQSSDNALEAIQKSPILSNDQKEYAKQLREQIQKAIPWTSEQAQEFARRGEGGESFSAFMQQQSGQKSHYVGEILTVGGKKYRVTGGDMSDPDVEPAQ